MDLRMIVLQLMSENCKMVVLCVLSIFIIKMKKIPMVFLLNLLVLVLPKNDEMYGDDRVQNR